jgi:hypothetical protein
MPKGVRIMNQVVTAGKVLPPVQLQPDVATKPRYYSNSPQKYKRSRAHPLYKSLFTPQDVELKRRKLFRKNGEQIQSLKNFKPLPPRHVLDQSQTPANSSFVSVSGANALEQSRSRLTNMNAIAQAMDSDQSEIEEDLFQESWARRAPPLDFHPPVNAKLLNISPSPPNLFESLNRRKR